MVAFGVLVNSVDLMSAQSTLLLKCKFLIAKSPI